MKLLILWVIILAYSAAAASGVIAFVFTSLEKIIILFNKGVVIFALRGIMGNTTDGLTVERIEERKSPIFGNRALDILAMATTIIPFVFTSLEKIATFFNEIIILFGLIAATGVIAAAVCSAAAASGVIAFSFTNLGK